MIRATYPAPHAAAAVPTCTFIPQMTDPLGRYWRQPEDMTEVEFDDKHALLTQAQFDGLSEYSTTTPSGVYPGKCWKGQMSMALKKDGKVVGTALTDRWLLRWYGICEDPKMCSVNSREIIIL